jgi:sortase A
VGFQRVCRTATILGTLLLFTVGLWHYGTTRTADAAQGAMAREWAENVYSTSPTVSGVPERPTVPATAPVEQPSPPPGAMAAIARLDVRRPGTGTPLGDPLFVAEGVDQEQIDLGPGHFPDSALPGQAGNFAVAGHRTTHGAPFADLDQLRAGDEILVTDRAGQRYLYRVVEQRIVSPTDTWVAGPDPLGTGRPTLTLTTCHPRYSARQRLVVWAELARAPSPPSGPAE